MTNVCKIREAAGLTIDQLAMKAGVSSNVVRVAEGRDPNRPYRTSNASATLLAAALNVEVNDLFDPLELSDLGRPTGTKNDATGIGCVTARRASAASPPRRCVRTASCSSESAWAASTARLSPLDFSRWQSPDPTPERSIPVHQHDERAPPGVFSWLKY